RDDVLGNVAPEVPAIAAQIEFVGHIDQYVGVAVLNQPVGGIARGGMNDGGSFENLILVLMEVRKIDDHASLVRSVKQAVKPFQRCLIKGAVGTKGAHIGALQAYVDHQHAVG